MAVIVNLNKLFRSDGSLGQMHERDEMREWLSTNVGPYVSGANIGEGWTMNITDATSFGQVYWHVVFENDSDALMFKLTFS